MTFRYVTLNADELQKLRPRINGPVLSSLGSAAIDDDTGAVLLALGGKPSLDPSRGKPPGHYNLIWGADVFLAAGNYQTEKEGDGYVRCVSLCLEAPRSAEDKIDQVQQLLGEALAALYSGMHGAPLALRLTCSNVSYR